MDYMVLDKDDRLRFSALALFKKYGYDRYRTAKFESYEVYRRNKDYIGDESIVTFTSAEGKLMALRPDVTLGIVNNLTEGARKKLCYDENVFRRDKRGEYREIRQTGVENIGALDAYSEYETVSLAVKAMELIGEEYVLTVGHMDVVEALLNEVELCEADRAKALEYIVAKATHELKKLVGEKGKTLIELVSIEGEWQTALERAKKIIGKRAGKAMTELASLMNALESSGLDKRVKIDFSLISDYRYYNGIVFRGFVRTLPYAVLLGGRYDNMMKRLGKGDSALGFALDFDALAGLYEKETGYDALVVYGNASSETVAKKVDELVKQGKRVFTVQSDDGKIKATEKIVLSEAQND